MSTTVAGAEVAVQLDLGEVPIILGRDILDATAILTDVEGSYSDIDPVVMGAHWTWGSNDPRGLLTDVESGRAIIDVLDPARTLDPQNASRTTILSPGAHGRVLVDGVPAFTGYLDGVDFALADGIATVLLQDAIPRLSGQTVVTTLAPGWTTTQLAAVLDAVGWPASLRVVYGSPTAYRDEDVIVMSAWAALLRIRDAELGDLWIDRAGRVAFRCRGIAPDATTAAELGDAATAVGDLRTTLRRVAIVNHVALDMADPTPDREWADGPSVALNGRRSVSHAADDLKLIEAP